jgi:hypothetical protein
MNRPNTDTPSGYLIPTATTPIARNKGFESAPDLLLHSIIKNKTSGVASLNSSYFSPVDTKVSLKSIPSVEKATTKRILWNTTPKGLPKLSIENEAQDLFSWSPSMESPAPTRSLYALSPPKIAEYV